jgi:adenine phosphoribosyltransferase
VAAEYDATPEDDAAPEDDGANRIGEVVASRLRDIPDFPEPGILFKDVTPLLADGAAFGAVTRDVAGRHTGPSGPHIDLVAGIEARGFIFGGAIAHELGIGFVPVRKAGKLPGDVIGVSYDLEYGTATIEVHADSFAGGKRVLLVDDVLATGGTAAAAWDLIERAGGTVVAFEAILELSFLPGRARLGNRSVHALLTV